MKQTGHQQMAPIESKQDQKYLADALKKYQMSSNYEFHDHIKDSQFGSNLIGYIDQVHGRQTLDGLKVPHYDEDKAVSDIGSS